VLYGRLKSALVDCRSLAKAKLVTVVRVNNLWGKTQELLGHVAYVPVDTQLKCALLACDGVERSSTVPALVLRRGNPCMT